MEQIGLLTHEVFSLIDLANVLANMDHNNVDKKDGKWKQMSDATRQDVWTVVLHEMMMHIQKFIDDNPMGYKKKRVKGIYNGVGYGEYTLQEHDRGHQ